MVEIDIDVHAHVLPGLILFLAGFSFAWICYRRLLQMAKTSSSSNTIATDYCRQYFPEPNPTVLRVAGACGMTMAMVGYLVLTITEVPYGMSLFSDTFHLMLYFLYFTTGLVWVLESYGRVPADASRLTLAIAQAMEGLLLLIHSGMKHTDTEILQHQLVAVTVILGTLALFTSLIYTEWLAPWLVFLGAFCWQGLWWVAIGISFLWEDENGDPTVKYKDVSVHFTLIGMVLFFIGLVAAAQIDRARGGNTATNATKYERAPVLLSNNDDDDEEKVVDDNHNKIITV